MLENNVIVSGFDKELVGQHSSSARDVRPHQNRNKGKGIRWRRQRLDALARQVRSKMLTRRESKQNVASSHPAAKSTISRTPRLAVFRSHQHIYAQVIDD